MEQVIFILLDGFADWEYAPLAAELANPAVEHPAYQVLFASDTLDLKKSIAGLRVQPDITLEDIPSEAAALILVGGTSWRTPAAEPVADIVRDYMARGRVVGAICDATRFLAVKGLLNAHKHTLNFPGDAEGAPSYQNAEGFMWEEAVRDSNLVTANGNAPYPFGREVLLALGTEEKEATKWYEFYTLGFHNAMAKYYPQA